jgi:CubicO group peptidase (beta-lactamase class C family)
MSGLQIHAADLAKLGQLALDRGRWQRERLIAESWFEESLNAATAHDPTSGLLWWLIPENVFLVIDDENFRALGDAGVDPAFLARMEPLKGRYDSRDEVFAAIARTFGDEWRPTFAEALGSRMGLLVGVETGEIIGYRADGYLGQYIIIYPAQRLVAVRLVTSSPAYDHNTDGFREFGELVRGLTLPR